MLKISQFCDTSGWRDGESDGDRFWSKRYTGINTVAVNTSKFEEKYNGGTVSDDLCLLWNGE